MAYKHTYIHTYTAGVIVAVVWYFISWRPFILKSTPTDDETEQDKTKTTCQSAMDQAKSCANQPIQYIKLRLLRLEPIFEWLRDLGVTEFFKMIFSFYQIIGSFPEIYNIKWPLSIGKFFQDTSSVAYLDIIGALGIACVALSYDYFTLQLVFLRVCIRAFICMCVCVYVCMGV
jgi:hypothetical protein